MALLTTEEQVNILMQEAARLNEEIINLHKINEKQNETLMKLTDAILKGFTLTNEKFYVLENG